MKNKRQELLIKSSGKYRRDGQLNSSGIYIDHLYEGENPLSWSDDFGFWLGSQWVSVYWQHPRSVYLEEISRLAHDRAGEYPAGNFFDGSIPNYRKIGLSRKKIVSWTTHKMNNDHAVFYDRLRNIEDQLCAEGINFEVKPSIQIFQKSWGRLVILCSDETIRSEDDVTRVAVETREMLRHPVDQNGKTALQRLQSKQEEPYCREAWLKDWAIEQVWRAEQRKKWQNQDMED